MKKNYYLPLILVLIIVPLLLFYRQTIFKGNTSLQESTPHATVTTIPIYEPLLEGTTWQWIETKNVDGSSTTPSNPSSFRMVLKNGNMSSQTDCNAITAPYIVDHEVLSFSPIVGTKMYCEESLEASYIATFPLVTSYTIENAILTFILIKDQGTVRFKALE